MSRRFPALVADSAKAVHQPQRRRPVAAVLDEGKPFGIGDEVAREFNRADQRAVRRLFIVEMKTVVAVPDRVNALVERDPFFAGASLLVAAAVRGGEGPCRIVGRRNRVLRKGVQDVGEHQFLMLLLVVEPDLDQRHQPCERRFVSGLEEFHDRGVDMPAIGGDFDGAEGRVRWPRWWRACRGPALT